MNGTDRNWWFGWSPENITSEPSQPFDQIREFIYLDDRSVRSLLASTGEGGIPAEITDQSSLTKSSQNKIGVESNWGPIGGSAAHRRSTEEGSQKTEVQNFDLTQSKFTHLYNSDRVDTEFTIETIDDLMDSENKELTTLSEINRGDIIEVRIKPSAHLMFRLYKVMDYFQGVVPESFSADDERILEFVRESIGQTIPVIGTAVNISVSDNRLLVCNQPENPLEIGVFLDLSNLWIDPTQMLFENKEYVLYCRVESVNPENWYPLKMTRVLSSLSEEVAGEFQEVMQDGLDQAQQELSKMNFGSSTNGASSTTESNDLVIYSQILEDHYDINISDITRDKVINRSLAKVDIDGLESDTEIQKRILTRYTEEFNNYTETDPLTPSAQVEMRTAFRKSKIDTNSHNDDQGSNKDKAPNHMEVSAISIYW